MGDCLWSFPADQFLASQLLLTRIETEKYLQCRSLCPLFIFFVPCLLFIFFPAPWFYFPAPLLILAIDYLSPPCHHWSAFTCVTLQKSALSEHHLATFSMFSSVFLPDFLLEGATAVCMYKYVLMVVVVVVVGHLNPNLCRNPHKVHWEFVVGKRQEYLSSNSYIFVAE